MQIKWAFYFSVRPTYLKILVERHIQLCIISKSMLIADVLLKLSLNYILLSKGYRKIQQSILSIQTLIFSCREIRKNLRIKQDHVINIDVNLNELLLALVQIVEQKLLYQLVKTL